MSDDRLRTELEALERLAPDDTPPAPRRGSTHRRSLLGPTILLTVGAAAVVVIGTVLTWRPPATSSSPRPTAEPSLPASSATTPPSLPSVLEWQEVTSLPADEGFVDQVNDATAWVDGIVAVGARYILPDEAYQDMIPEGGRVWLSSDGHDWEELPSEQAFDGIELTQVFESEDGSLTIIGRENSQAAARYWRSADARSWVEVSDLGLPAGLLVFDADVGERGFLIAGAEYELGYELWFSRDGTAWERVWSEPQNNDTRERVHGVAAGSDGFAAWGWSDVHLYSTSLVLASTDGRQWTAPAEPVYGGVTYLTTLDGALVAVATRRQEEGGPYVAPPTPRLWTSADGSRWRQVGRLTIDAPQLDGDPTCATQVTHVVGAGRWLVMSADFYCAYGADVPEVRGHLKPVISLDGSAWQPLPFNEASLAPSTSSRLTGSMVRVAVATDSGLLLAGESNGQLTFWLGEGP